MRAAVTTGPHHIEVTDVPNPIPEPDDAVVDVGAVGLCGTDLHMWAGERHDTGFPLRQGHEIGGTISALPAYYTGSLRVGDTVTVNPSLPCGDCRPCVRGSWWACRQFRSIGNQLPGGLAEQVVVPVGQLHAAPGLSAAEAALCEPFSIASMAISRAQLRGDERVVVIGGGPIGLAVTLCAVVAGHEVLVTDPLPARRDFAKSLGAALSSEPGEQLTQVVGQWTRGAGADVAVEASGTGAGLEDAVATTGSAGRVVVVGVTSNNLLVPVPRLLFDGVTIVGARGGMFPQALGVVTSHRDLVARFISRTFPLEHSQDAFDHAVEHAAGIVKVLVEVAGP